MNSEASENPQSCGGCCVSFTTKKIPEVLGEVFEAALEQRIREIVGKILAERDGAGIHGSE